MTGELIRSFIAIEVSNPSVLQEISEAQRVLLGTGADLKAVEPQNIHVTLKFLGDIELSQVDGVYEVMKKISVKSFEIEFKGLGVFPSLSRMNVIWVGITRGYEKLSRIAAELDEGLKPLGFQPENRKFSAHLTIIRVKSQRNREALASEAEKFTDREFGVVAADSLKLKKSVLTPQGPIYSTLREVNF